MRIPEPLHLNDRAIIISPSGNINDYLVHDTSAVLEEWGLITEISKFALGENGRFSGSVEERLKDLQQAMDHPSIKLIVCSRGGYGLVHLLNKLDFRGIKRNPKWVIGFSDITALHSALQVNGIASIHAPMAKHFSNGGVNDLSVRYTKSVLAGQPINYEISVNNGISINRFGVAAGKLFGGNLSVLCGLIGTPFLRIPNKGILFIEDTGEIPYKVDRMLNHLKLAGVFNRISGLIIGKFTDYDEDDQMYFPLQESILGVVNEYNFPVAFNFPVGHVNINLPLILGEIAELLVLKDKVTFKQFK